MGSCPVSVVSFLGGILLMAESEGKTEGLLGKLIRAIAVIFSLFQLYTAFFGIFPAFQQRVVHLSFALCLIFLLSQSKGSRKVIDYVLAGTCMAIGIWSFAAYKELWLRGGAPATTDVIVGMILTAAVLEGTRRAIGWTLPILSVLFILYAKFGNYFPEPFTHRGHDMERIINDLYLSTNGIFGIPLGVSSTMVAIFIIFAALLQGSGGGKIFIDLAMSLFGTVRGGPAKIAIVASGLFGTISGSAVANVAGTGTFTIPLMKHIGFHPRFAGAVEATASTGGQLMPPVMGAAAFIMAEILHIPYVAICIAAVIPAILYFVVLFLHVDSESVLRGLKGMPRSQLPILVKVLQQAWYVLIPLGILIYALVIARFTEVTSASMSIIALLAMVGLGKIFRRSGAGFKEIVMALENGGRDMISVALTCACAGIVIGTVMLTGLGHELSGILINFAAGQLGILLMITAVASLILGMGLPTSACYIILAILVAPAIVEFGVPTLAAHMFIFYVGLMANVTPPVALAAYAGAGIAGADPFKTGFTACRLAMSGFILPFFFVFRPELLLIGPSASAIAFSILVIGVALVSMVAVTTGYLLIGRLRKIPRILLLMGSTSLIYPSYTSDIVGFCLVIGGYCWALLDAAKERGGVVAWVKRGEGLNEPQREKNSQSHPDQ